MTTPPARGRDDLNLRAGFDFGIEVIRSLHLVNGGAAAAVLAFYGSTVSQKLLNADLIAWALICFAVGLLMAVGAGICAYFAQLYWGIEIDADAQVERAERKALRLQKAAVALGMLSALLFATGVGAAALAFWCGAS